MGVSHECTQLFLGVVSKFQYEEGFIRFPLGVVFMAENRQPVCFDSLGFKRFLSWSSFLNLRELFNYRYTAIVPVTEVLRLPRTIGSRGPALVTL